MTTPLRSKTGLIRPPPQRASDFAIYYGFRRLPMRVDAQDVALLAEAETARGVRTVRG